jgi:hypothetical protein
MSLSSNINPPPSALYNSTTKSDAQAPTVEIQDIVLSQEEAIVEFGGANVPRNAAQNNNICTVRLQLATGTENPALDTTLYDNKGYTAQTRLRGVVCTDKNFGQKSLDYISQRINEYLSGQMAQVGFDGVQSFYDQVFAQTGEESSAALSAYGVFDTDFQTRKMKGEKQRIETFAGMPGIKIFDASLLGLLSLSSDGRAKTRVSPDKITIPSQNGQTLSYQKVVVPLEKIAINLGSDPIEHLSIYFFVYNDYSEFLSTQGIHEEKDFSTELGKEVESPLQTGMGFISSLTAVGDKAVYERQNPSAAVVGPVNSQIKKDPNISLFSDIAKVKNTFTARTANKLTEGFYESMVSRNRGSNNFKNISPGTAAALKYKNYFSDLWLTKDKEENARYIFSFDKRSFLRDNSSYPRLYLDKTISQELLEGGGLLSKKKVSRILDIRMVRRRLYRDRVGATNDLGTMLRQDSFDASIDNKEQAVASPRLLSNIYLNNPGVDFYQGYDTYAEDVKKQSPALYQYGVTFYLQESSIAYLIALSKKLEEDISGVRQLYETYISDHKQKIFNPQTGERYVAYNTINIEGTSGSNLVKTLIRTYSQVLNVIAPGTSNDDMRELENYVQQPGIAALLDFLSMAKSLQKKIDQFISVKFPGETFNLGAGQKDILERKGLLDTKYTLLEVTHYFDEPFDLSDNYRNGYVYLPTTSDTAADNTGLLVPSLTMEKFQGRASSEFEKYFSKYEKVSEDVDENTAPASAFAEPFNSSAHTYFSPEQIRLYGQESINQTSFKMVGSNQTNYDIDRYASLLIELMRQKKNKEYNFLEFNARQGGDSDIQKLYNSISDQFAENDIILLADNIKTTADFPPLKTKTFKDIVTAGADNPCGDRSYLKQPNLLPIIFGGDDDTSDSIVFYYKSADQKIINEDFKNLTEKNTPLAQVPTNQPVKLAFSILGQLEFSVDSFTNIAKTISFNQQNSVKMLAGPLKNIPNQSKAMLVISENTDSENFFGGLDAVRNIFGQTEEAAGSGSISATMQGKSFPPYQTTQDPTKVYSQLTAFWMNYQQLGVIEYLAGFASNSPTSFSARYVRDNSNAFYLNRKAPEWRKLSSEIIASAAGQNLLCRIRPISDTDNFSLRSEKEVAPPVYGTTSSTESQQTLKFEQKELFNLPIYDKYFILKA